MAYRCSLVWQENTDSMYSMFEVRGILNTDVSLSQVELIENCGKTSVKLKGNVIPQRSKVKKSYQNHIEVKVKKKLG